MAAAKNLDVLSEEIRVLRKELEHKIGGDINRLSSSEVLEITQKIDQLVIDYIEFTMNR